MVLTVHRHLHYVVDLDHDAGPRERLAPPRPEISLPHSTSQGPYSMLDIQHRQRAANGRQTRATIIAGVLSESGTLVVYGPMSAEPVIIGAVRFDREACRVKGFLPQPS
jgi:hypothetical protein